MLREKDFTFFTKETMTLLCKGDEFGISPILMEVYEIVSLLKRVFK
jgi:hypothetical protein